MHVHRIYSVVIVGVARRRVAGCARERRPAARRLDRALRGFDVRERRDRRGYALLLHSCIDRVSAGCLPYRGA